MTEAEMQKRIAYQFGLINGNIVLPNVFLTVGGVGQYEADLLYITSKRYCTEVEIKISMADFKADFKKKIYHNSDIVRNFYYAFPYELYQDNSTEINLMLSDSDAGIMIVKDFAGRCVRILRDPKPRRDIKPISEQKRYELMRVGCIKWYTANRIKAVE